MRGITGLMVLALAFPLSALPARAQISESASQKNPTGATAITPGQSESQAAERERKEMPATLETERSAPPEGNATGGPGGPVVPPYPLEKNKQTRDGQAEGAAGGNPTYR